MNRKEKNSMKSFLLGFVVCSTEMILAHELIFKYKDIWDYFSLIINIAAYVFIFSFSGVFLLIVSKQKKIRKGIFLFNFLPYMLIFIYFIFFAMPSYVRFSFLNILLFPLFPLIAGIIICDPLHKVSRL